MGSSNETGKNSGKTKTQDDVKNKKTKEMKQQAKTDRKLAKEERKRAANREAAARDFERRISSQKGEDGKIITKYDKKQEYREREKKKDRRNRMIGCCALAAVAVILVGLLGFFAYDKAMERFGTTVTVDGEKIGRVEFDYYYNVAYNNFMNSYGVYASYFGLDTTKSLSKQTYYGDETWEDYFNSSAIEILKRTKALSKEADDNGYEYDVTDDYQEFLDSINDAVTTGSETKSQYYRETFGKYATESGIESYVKQYLRANAYYESVTEGFTFTQEEQDAYYEEHKDDYDLVDYRVVQISDVDKATEFLNAVSDGESFASLCAQYVDDDDKATYESDDASLVEGVTKSGVEQSTTVSEWLYDSSRVQGDKSVIAASDGVSQYVVYFIQRYVTDDAKSGISDTMVSEKSTEYLENLMDAVEVVDGTVKQYVDQESSED